MYHNANGCIDLTINYFKLLADHIFVSEEKELIPCLANGAHCKVNPFGKKSEKCMLPWIYK